jgi:hypothetical protein
MTFGQRHFPPALVSAIIVGWMIAGAQAQEAKDPGAAKAAMQAKVAELKQSLAANQKALQQYTWVETTEISMKGEVKKTEQKECRYGTDGKVVKTDMGGGTPQPAQSSQGGGGKRRGGRGGGAVKEKVIENKVEGLKEYMGAVATLVKQYVPPDPAKIQAAAQSGKAAMDNKSAPGITELTFTDYAVPGDRLAISLNAAAKQLAGVNVSSVLGKDKDPVTLAVRFASLPDGVNYPAETVLVAKAKQIQVKITNSGHHK